MPVNLWKVCSDSANQWADTFNTKLTARLNNLQTTFPGAKFVYVYMYNLVLISSKILRLQVTALLNGKNKYVPYIFIVMFPRIIVCYLLLV